MRSLILRRLLLRNVFKPDEKYIGILLPPTVAGVVVNAAVTLAGRVSANLNYTTSNEVLNACIRQAGIRHVLTSKKVMEKFNFKLDAGVVILGSSLIAVGVHSAGFTVLEVQRSKPDQEGSPGEQHSAAGGADGS